MTPNPAPPAHLLQGLATAAAAACCLVTSCPSFSQAKCFCYWETRVTGFLEKRALVEFLHFSCFTWSWGLLCLLFLQSSLHFDKGHQCLQILSSEKHWLFNFTVVALFHKEYREFISNHTSESASTYMFLSFGNCIITQWFLIKETFPFNFHTIIAHGSASLYLPQREGNAKNTRVEGCSASLWTREHRARAGRGIHIWGGFLKPSPASWWQMHGHGGQRRDAVGGPTSCHSAVFPRGAFPLLLPTSSLAPTQQMRGCKFQHREQPRQLFIPPRERPASREPHALRSVTEAWSRVFSRLNQVCEETATKVPSAKKIKFRAEQQTWAAFQWKVVCTCFLCSWFILFFF